MTTFGIRFEPDDLNGDCFIAGAEGEREELIGTNIYAWPYRFPAQTEDNKRKPITVTKEQAEIFMACNIFAQRAVGVEENLAIRISYLRLVAARNGLVSPNYVPAAHNVRYSDVVQVDQHDTQEAIDNAKKDKDFGDKINAALGGGVMRKLRVNFSTIACCVAYMFRVRGHHYRDDFKERYTSLWARCLMKPDDLPIEWEYVATNALHAIMPDILDAYWGDCVAEATCAGTLRVRYESAPAGSAGVLALKKGLDDVRMLFPGITSQVKDSYDFFNNIINQLEGTRWGGSINSRFYGVQRVRVDESKIGAIASMVMGVYDQLATDSKLRESPSLKRLAQLAPATGGAIGLAARRTVGDERLNLIGYAASAVP